MPGRTVVVCTYPGGAGRQGMYGATPRVPGAHARGLTRPLVEQLVEPVGSVGQRSGAAMPVQERMKMVEKISFLFLLLAGCALGLGLLLSLLLLPFRSVSSMFQDGMWKLFSLTSATTIILTTRQTNPHAGIACRLHRAVWCPAGSTCLDRQSSCRLLWRSRYDNKNPIHA